MDNGNQETATDIAKEMREALDMCVSDYESGGLDETTEKWHAEHFGESSQSLVAWRKAKAALRNYDAWMAEKRAG